MWEISFLQTFSKSCFLTLIQFSNNHPQRIFFSEHPSYLRMPVMKRGDVNNMTPTAKGCLTRTGLLMSLVARKIFTPAFGSQKNIYPCFSEYPSQQESSCFQQPEKYLPLFFVGRKRCSPVFLLEYHPIYSCNEKGDINNSAQRLSSPIQDSSCSAFVRLNQQYNKGLIYITLCCSLILKTYCTAQTELYALLCCSYQAYTMNIRQINVSCHRAEMGQLTTDLVQLHNFQSSPGHCPVNRVALW